MQAPPRALRGLRGVAHAGDKQGKFDVLQSRQDGQEVEGLEDETHAPAAQAGALLVAHLGKVLAFQDDLAASDVIEAGETVEKRRLAAARWTHDGDHLAAAHFEVDVDEGLDAQAAGLVGLAETASLNDRLGRSGTGGRKGGRLRQPWAYQHGGRLGHGLG